MSFQVIVIFIVIVTCNMCKSEDELKTVIEGGSVHLHYPYPCNSTRITLQFGMRAPFYTLADTESIFLSPLRVHRFTFKNKSQHDHCSLHVIINPVTRTDHITYIFFAYSEDGIYESYFKRIGLDVALPPGKASCTMGEENIVGNWVALNCIAPVGSLSGQIDCYQNDERMPTITSPTETHKYLKQTILVKKKHAVFCCSSTWEHTKDMCDCDDFQWDLANDKNLSSVIDPCGPTIAAQEQTQTSKTAFISSNPIFVSIGGTTSKINNQYVSVLWKYVSNGLGSSLIIACLIVLVIASILISRKCNGTYT